MCASKPAFEPEAVRRQLGQILASSDFDASERNRRFLNYAVEETLEGRAHRIKAYAVATSVFGRGKDFDPQMDAIVRIEAGRLRRSLEHYYLKAGRDDSIRISIPRGSYAAAFDRPEGDGPPSGHSPALETASPPLDAMGPAILVTPFEEDGFHSEFSNFHPNSYPPYRCRPGPVRRSARLWSLGRFSTLFARSGLRIRHQARRRLSPGWRDLALD